jgi:hypothetical protein
MCSRPKANPAYSYEPEPMELDGKPETMEPDGRPEPMGGRPERGGRPGPGDKPGLGGKPGPDDKPGLDDKPEREPDGMPVRACAGPLPQQGSSTKLKPGARNCSNA